MTTLEFPRELDIWRVPCTVTDDRKVGSEDKLFDDLDYNNIFNNCYTVFHVALCRLSA